MIRCFQRVTVICRPHLGEAIRVAVVVGTVLFAINQLDAVLAGSRRQQEPSAGNR